MSSSSKKTSDKKKGGSAKKLNLDEISNIRVQQELSLRGLILDGDDNERRERLREAIDEGIEPMPIGQKDLSKMKLELENFKKVYTRMFATSPEIAKWGSGKRQVSEDKAPANSEWSMFEVVDGFHPPKNITEFSLRDDSRFNELPDDQEPITNVTGLSYKVRGAIGDDEEDSTVKKLDTDAKHRSFQPLGEDEEPRYTGPLTGAKGKAKELGLKSVKCYINTHMSPAEIKGYHYLTLVEQVKHNTNWLLSVAQLTAEEHNQNRATILRLEAVVQQLVIAINELTDGSFNERVTDLVIPGLQNVLSRQVPEIQIARVPEIQGAVDDYKDLDEFDMEEGGRNRYHLIGPQSSATTFTKIPREQAEAEDAPQMVQRVVAGKSPVGYISSQIIKGNNAAGTSAAPMASSPATSSNIGAPSPSRRATGGKAPRKSYSGKAPRKSYSGKAPRNQELYARKTKMQKSDEDEDEEEVSSSSEKEESPSVSETFISPSPKRIKATDDAIQISFGTNPKGTSLTQDFSFEVASTQSSFSDLEGDDPLLKLFDQQLEGRDDWVAKGIASPGVIFRKGN